MKLRFACLSLVSLLPLACAGLEVPAASTGDAGADSGTKEARDAGTAVVTDAGAVTADADAATADADAPAPEPACAGKACGEDCTGCGIPGACDDYAICNSRGQCIHGVSDPGCTTVDAGPAKADAANLGDAGAYAPCANMACGTPCRVCDPRDATCVETAIAKYCLRGQCADAVDDQDPCL